MNAFVDAFSDPNVVSKYAEGPPRFVPGFADLHRMTAILLGERVAADGHVLVVGAGGGLELKALAEAHPGWRFDGVDPSREMLRLAAQSLGAASERVHLTEGYIDDAPEGPFDAATCLLTLHFIERKERLRTLQEMRRRLKSGAPFVVAHSSFPQGKAERALWLSRYAAFAAASGLDPALAEKARASVDEALFLLSPDEDDALLRAAGFSDVSLFYAAFTWRGWVGYA